MKILCITATRADFPRIKSVLSLIRDSQRHELLLAVTGGHLVGDCSSKEEIISEGFEIADEFKIYDDELYSRDLEQDSGEVFIRASKGALRALRKLSPDMALLTVDRIETLAFASICALENVPILHVQGGELSGTIDESIRHAVSKLSHFHAVANQMARERLIQMGEASERVFVTGCPMVDVIFSQNNRQDYRKHTSILGIGPEERFAILVFHSVTTSRDENEKLCELVNVALATLREKKIKSVGIMSNLDEGSRLLSKILEENADVVFSNLNSTDFIELMRWATVLIGNSSAGIREAPSFGLPAINVGTRQRDRDRDSNVIDVGLSPALLRSSIDRWVHTAAISRPFRRELRSNLYGDGGASFKLLEVIDHMSVVLSNGREVVLNKQFSHIRRRDQP